MHAFYVLRQRVGKVMVVMPSTLMLGKQSVEFPS
jgi:hypothetical protein